MQEKDFPALNRSADSLSLKAQKNFFAALGVHLSALVLATILSTINTPNQLIAVLQLLALLAALSCSIYLFAVKPDKLWYAGRAVAESIKTISWRYVSRAEPFQDEDAIASHEFRQKLKAIVDQNRYVCQALTKHLGEAQITDVMDRLRSQALEERKKTYKDTRISEQLTWYAKKSLFNGRMSNTFFWALIAINAAGVVCAAFRVAIPNQTVWPTDILVAVAASLLSWMQAKRFSELAASYSLAAHEISLIREQSLLSDTDVKFSHFVSDAENAFSREHTQWIARRDL